MFVISKLVNNRFLVDSLIDIFFYFNYYTLLIKLVYGRSCLIQIMIYLEETLVSHDQNEMKGNKISGVLH